MSKKGVSLPVNVLVVLAIAIVVLLGVIAFFSGSLNPTKTAMSKQQVLSVCCSQYVQAGGCESGSSVSASGITCPKAAGSTSAKTLDTLASSMGVTVKQACGC